MPNRKQAPAEFTSVAYGPGHDLKASMIFLAVMAYPEELAKRDRAIRAMEDWCKRVPNPNPAAPPLSSTLRVQQMNNTLRLLAKRIDKGLLAARVAFRLLVVTDGSLSLNDIAQAQDDSGHLKDLIWAPTMPVLHLAIALNSATTTYFRSVEQQVLRPTVLTIYKLLIDSGWVGAALRDAEKYAEQLSLASNLPPALRRYSATPIVHLVPIQSAMARSISRK